MEFNYQTFMNMREDSRPYTFIALQRGKTKEICDVFEMCDKLESPIEKILYISLSAFVIAVDFPISVFPQHEIKIKKHKYRADFLVTCGESELIVECDGYDFHERTQKQVDYRNNRDIDFQNAGYTIFHFSGSEIHRDSMLCAMKIIKNILVKEKVFEEQINNAVKILTDVGFINDEGDKLI